MDKPTSEPIRKTVDESLAELEACVERMKRASLSSIAEAEHFARTARDARPSRSTPAMRAVRPALVEDEGPDVTSRYAALRRPL